jgi:hypothetical protein
MNPVVTPTLIPSKYTAATMGLIITVVFALQVAITDGITAVEGWNLGALAVGAIITYYAPLVGSKNTTVAAIMKIAGAVVAAVVIVIVDALNAGLDWNAQTIVAVAFAGLNALAAQIGVSARVSEVKTALENPAVPNKEVVAADAKGVVQVAHSGAVVGVTAGNVPGLAD